MLSILFVAASLSFSATATGVEKGTPIEFLFAGKDTDRDYETMFLLDESVGDLCARLEKAGLPKGRAASIRDCILWPVGCRVTLKPKMSEFIETAWPEGLNPAEFVYTGGTRTEKGNVVANDDMPLAFCALYSLAQAPIVYNGIYPQGDIYGAHTARVTLKKGERRTFVLSWDEASRPTSLDVTFTPGSGAQELLKIKAVAETGEVTVQANFDSALTVAEARKIAQALALVDSVRVKLNGRAEGRLFYRAFQPPAAWRDRQQRLAQPFELTVGETSDTLVFIEEDWTVEGNDPKLTPRAIPFAEARQHPRTDTCFIYATDETRLERLYAAMQKLKDAKIVNWYVFGQK